MLRAWVGKQSPVTASFPVVSLGLLVYFADHLVHSIQVDAIVIGVERSTLAVIPDGLFAGGQDARTCRSGRCQSPRSARGTSRRCVRPGCWPAPPGRGFARGCGRGSANTWWPGRRWRGSGAARRVIRPPIRRRSCRCWTPGSGSASSALWSKTPRSASGNWSISCARRCPRRSTTRTRRPRPSPTCR
jgi:hypothetical protein